MYPRRGRKKIINILTGVRKIFIFAKGALLFRGTGVATSPAAHRTGFGTKNLYTSRKSLLNSLNQVNQLNKLNQFRQLNLLNTVNPKLNQLNKIRQINQLGPYKIRPTKSTKSIETSRPIYSTISI